MTRFTFKVSMKDLNLIQFYSKNLTDKIGCRSISYKFDNRDSREYSDKITDSRGFLTPAEVGIPAGKECPAYRGVELSAFLKKLPVKIYRIFRLEIFKNKNLLEVK